MSVGPVQGALALPGSAGLREVHDPRAVVPGTGESGAKVLLPAGSGNYTDLYVAVRGMGSEGASEHVHIADSVARTNIIE